MHLPRCLSVLPFGWLPLAAFAQPVTRPVPGAAMRPNVVVILVDDMGYGDLGCYGSARIRTPRIDRMAAEGLRFTDFYSGTSVCAPSRAAWMTGLHTGHTAVRGNREVRPEGQYPLPDSSLTMAELFRAAGYATGGFGKWGLGAPGSSGDPMAQGFTRFYGYNCQREAHHPYPGHLWSDRQRVLLDNRPDRQTQYAPDLIQEQALSFLTAHAGGPFFLYLAYTPPHAALQVPPGDSAYAAYRTAFGEVAQPVAPWSGSGYQPNAYPRAAYAAMVSRLDRYVGEVLDRLRELGIDDNTLVLFSSDNGPHREGGNDPAFFRSAAGFRGVKRSLYEGGIRVPLIVRWPAVVRAARVTGHVAAAWDWLQTMAGLLGADLSGPTDGLSMLPLLRGRGRQARHPHLYWEFHEEEGRQAVRLGRWKGLRQRVAAAPGGPVELYDLRHDPAEQVDVAIRHPRVAARIARLLQEAHVEHPDFPLLRR
jgi:arylsulfatase A-like enzyme